MRCEARQHGDQMHCERCRLVWDVIDPYPPQCVPRSGLPGSGRPFLVTAGLMVGAMTALLAWLGS